MRGGRRVCGHAYVHCRYEYTTWYALLAPGATPKTVIAKLNQHLGKALGAGDLRDKLGQQGVEAEASTAEQLAAKIKQEIARWEKIIKAAGIQPET